MDSDDIFLCSDALEQAPYFPAFDTTVYPASCEGYEVIMNISYRNQQNCPWIHFALVGKAFYYLFEMLVCSLYNFLVYVKINMLNFRNNISRTMTDFLINFIWSHNFGSADEEIFGVPIPIVALVSRKLEGSSMHSIN